MTSMTWTLDAEGRLSVAWTTPPAAKATPARRRRASAVYLCIQMPFTCRRAA